MIETRRHAMVQCVASAVFVVETVSKRDLVSERYDAQALVC